VIVTKHLGETELHNSVFYICGPLAN